MHESLVYDSTELMNIDRVRYFHAFAQTGSLVKASEILHISQPALSKALKLLEMELGFKLIEPDGRGVRLTAKGMMFQEETRSLLSQWLLVTEKVRQKETVAPTSIGTFEVFSTYYLQTLTDAIDLKSLKIYEYTPGKLEDAILKGIVDLGITYLPISRSGLNYIEVTKIRMGLYGSKSWSNKPFEELSFVTPISPVEGIPSKMTGLDGWPEHKFPREISYNVTLMESALQLCRQGSCVAYLPSFVTRIHNEQVLSKYQLYELECPIPIKERMQSVYLIYKNQSTESKTHQRIIKTLSSLS